jgi:SAM-dependent methyltransferase/uncharacterized protein YbaR (Trm112 family)
MKPLLSVSLCCVRCQTATLIDQAHSLSCSTCKTVYPIEHGVPIMFPDVRVEPTSSEDLERIVQAVCDYQGLPHDDCEGTLNEIFSKKYQFSNFLLDVESQQYLDRIHSTQVHSAVASVASSDPVPAVISASVPGSIDLLATFKTVLKAILPRPIRQQISQRREQWRRTQAQDVPIPLTSIAPFSLKYEWVRDYLPRTVLANHRFTGNVRLKNRGETIISSQGETPVRISYHWRLTNNDEVCSVHEHRTPFPIDLQPGQEITIPMLLETPKEAGHYQLQICLIQEYVCWHEDDAVNIPVEITNQPLVDSTAKWQKDAFIYSYFDDHQQGISRLKDQLNTLETDRPKILEIGGNACPMLFYGFPGELYNLDIDVHGLQIGQLMDQQIKQNIERISFICADANDIPFPDDYLDCITMFASLHHFPDLSITLRSLGKKIKPEGFIAVLCEPVGHYYGEEIDPLFREELLKGVNEQSFSLAEYAVIFQEAGLIADRVIVDGCSLKAFLKKKPNSL